MLTHTSSRRILAWIPALAWAGFIFALSSMPGGALPELGLVGDLISVGTHIILYAVLMTALMVAIRRSTDLPSRHAQMLAFGLVALYALSDEFHQYFVPGRTATILDWLTDMIGATLAWGLLVLQENR